jgi:hypothetical protein
LDLVVLGLVITLEPIPLTGFLLVLASKNGVRKGAAFIFGWLASLAIIVALTLMVTGNNPPKPSTSPSLAILVVKLLIGAALVVVGLRQMHRRGRPKKPKKTPKWQTGVDNMSVWFAMALGPLTQPWALVAAGVATITEAKVSSAQDALTLIVFCIVSTAVYLGLEIYAGFWPTQTQALIARIRAWVASHTDQVIIILSFVAGFWLIAKSSASLLSS